MGNVISSSNKQLIQDIVSNNPNLRGDNLPALNYIIDKISSLDSAIGMAELIPEVSVIIADSTILTMATTAASIGSILLFPVGIMLNIANGMESALRMYGMRGAAYTITAWAYDDTRPISSPTILRYSTSGNVRAKAWDSQQRNKAWRSAGDGALKGINKKIQTLGIQKESLQLVLRAASDNNKQKLNLALLKSFEDQLSSHQKRVWKSNYKVRYPL